MKECPRRSEISEEMKWDLSPLYADLAAWDKDFKSLDRVLEHFMLFKGRLGESADLLAKAFDASDALDRLAEKLETFAHHKSDEDCANSANLARLERISTKSAELEGMTAWFFPEILALPEARILDMIKSPSLAPYAKTLKDLLREKEHMLSEPEERILGLASDLFSSPHGIFSVLNDADLRFPAVRDADGAEKELTHGNYIKFLESENREVRKSAFLAMHGKYSELRNTFAAALDGMVKGYVLNSKLRKYPKALSAALHSEDIPIEVFDNVIVSTRNNLHLLHRCMNLRQSLLKLDKMGYFDLRAPLLPIPAAEDSIAWDSARMAVSASVEILGGDYVEGVSRAFDMRWIDALENRGKRSGAYSGGCYDSPPYILMNYAASLEDVFTLAHELGHSMNSLLSNRKQTYHSSDISIFLGEIASNVNELLLHDYYERNADDKRLRFRLLCKLADEFRCVLYRQAMFSEFEKEIYEIRDSGEPLQADMLCENYSKLCAEYHGDALKDGGEIAIEWARIPHFYYNFYVFKYVTGFAAAMKIFARLKSDPSFLPRYLDFLSAGSSDLPMNLLGKIGIYPDKDDFFKEAFEKFDEVLTGIEKDFNSDNIVSRVS